MLVTPLLLNLDKIQEAVEVTFVKTFRREMFSFEAIIIDSLDH